MFGNFEILKKCENILRKMFSKIKTKKKLSFRLKFKFEDLELKIPKISPVLVQAGIDNGEVIDNLLVRLIEDYLGFEKSFKNSNYFLTVDLLVWRKKSEQENDVYDSIVVNLISRELILKKFFDVFNVEVFFDCDVVELKILFYKFYNFAKNFVNDFFLFKLNSFVKKELVFNSSLCFFHFENWLDNLLTFENFLLGYKDRIYMKNRKINFRRKIKKKGVEEF